MKRRGTVARTAAITIVLFFILPFTAAAVGLDLDLRMQMGMGGDKVASVEYSDGSTSDLRLGTYFSFAVGPNVTVWTRDVHAVEIQGLAGWGSWSTGPENTDDRLRLGRFPLELLAFYRLAPDLPVEIRLGGGIAYHLINGIVGTGNLDDIEADIENGLGWVAELGILYDIFAFSVRYTGMQYEVEGADDPLDASSLAAAVGVLIPLR